MAPRGSMRIAFALFGLALIARAAAPDDRLKPPARWLAGAYSCTAQTAATGDVRKLTMHAAPIWPERTDGPWLYVEQALAELPDSPYRQQALQLVARADGAIECRVFALADPVKMTGAWREPARFSALSPADLKPRAGCTIILRLQPDGTFAGSTEGQGCASELRGADYATTDMRITEREITLWERGFTAHGAQVWGPTQGGYIFKKTG